MVRAGWHSLRVVALATLLLPLCTLLVWFAVNWTDSTPEPLPEVLMMAADRIAPQANVYWDLAGVLAPAGADPNQVGLGQWQASTSARQAAVTKGQLPTAEGLQFVPLRMPEGPPWVCRNEAICDELWFQNSDALHAQLRGHELLIQRCQRIASSALNFEEPLATVDASGLFAPHLTGLAVCTRLLDAKGVLAVVKGDVPTAVQWFSLSNSLLRHVVKADRLAATQFAAGRALARHWRSLAASGRRNAQLAKMLLPLAGPLDPASFDLHRSAVGSAAFARSAVQSESALCAGGGPCGRWPHLPQQTQIDINGAWQAHLVQSKANPVDELDSVLVSPLSKPNGLEKLYLRNTWVRPGMASIRLDLLSGTAVLADVDLVRATVQLTLSAQALGLPTDERAAWLARQPMRASFRSRIELDVNAGSLMTRSWAREFNPTIPKEFLQFPLDAANP